MRFGVAEIVTNFSRQRKAVRHLAASPNTFTMLNIFISIFFQMTSILVDKPTELNPADLIQCVGQSFNEQKAFPMQVFREPLQSELDKYKYSRMIFSKTVEKPGQFSLFGIPADEIYIAIDSAQTILAVFVVVDNNDLVKKMTAVFGEDYVAVALSNGEEALPSSYLWDYKGKCVTLKLLAYQRVFVTTVRPDNGFVVFFNCEPSSYRYPLKEE